MNMLEGRAYFLHQILKVDTFGFQNDDPLHRLKDANLDFWKTLLDFYKPQYVKFIFYLLKAIKLENRGYNRHFKILKQQIIPLPPLAEQKAIVEKVENLMQKVSAMEEEIQKSEQNAKMLMQAVLKEAFEGKKEEEEV
jgi:hypothetical protein